MATTVDRVFSNSKINWKVVFSAARGVAKLKQEHVAKMMGISEPQLAQQLAGRGHLSFFRLVAVACDEDPAGHVFVAEVFRLVSEHLRLKPDDQAQTIGRALVALGGASAALGAVMAHIQYPRADPNDRRRVSRAEPLHA